MISSPILAQPAHLSTNSPTASPTLRPAEGVMAHDERVPRSTTRPYCSPRLARSRSRGTRGEVGAATRQFALAIVEIARARKSRAAELGVSPTHAVCSSSPGRECQHLVDLIVDVPVWSAGCFADLSTLHALRDNTLHLVHLLIGHLNDAHAIQTSYKLLARRPATVGWGAIHVAPSPFDAPGVVRPVRRTSFVRPERAGSGGVASPPRRLSTGAPSPLSGRVRPPSMTFEHAIADSESERSVELHTGYSNANANGRDSDDDDDDEEEADDLIAAEVRRRNEREGTTFVMNVKGGLNLIVV